MIIAQIIAYIGYPLFWCITKALHIRNISTMTAIAASFATGIFTLLIVSIIVFLYSLMCLYK